MAQYKNNPLYREVYPGFYAPAEDTQYHKSRELAMQAQDTFSRCGVSPEVLQSFVKEILDRVNKQVPITTFISDMSAIAHNLQYRINNTLDEQCILRMAAIGVFIEGENPDEVHEAYTRKKLDMAKADPALRDFFLIQGVALTPDYATICRGLQVREYLTSREEAINMLMLPKTP